MSNPVVSDEARTFYKIFKELRTYMTQTPDISLEDKQKIGELLRVLKYHVEFQILEDSVKSDDYITSVVADIDTKLLHIDEERREINETIGNMELVTNTRRLIALRRTSNELDRIKTYIENRQFGYYVEMMNQTLSSTNELVSACSKVLSIGHEDYTRMFGRDIVNPYGIDAEGINLLFSIITDKELKKELDSYLKAEDKYNAVLKQKNDNKRFLDLINLAKKNEVTFREYLKVRPVLSKASIDSIAKVRENLATSKLVLDNLKQDGLAGLFNKRQRDQLEIDILSYETQISEYEEKKKEAEKLELILAGIGLGDVVVALSNTVEGVELTVEEKVAAYLKASIKKSSFDVRPAQNKVNDSNKALDDILFRESIALSDVLNSLSNKAHKLVTTYHDDVVRINSLIKEKRNGFTPLLAAYILKMLSDARNLDYRDINDMCCLDIDIDNLLEYYASLNQQETREIQEQLENVAVQEEAFSNGEDGIQMRKI